MYAFIHRFKATPPGTHFWHAHAGMQRGDGMFGSLIIRQPPVREPHFVHHLYDADLPEHVLIVHDWMHELTIQKFSSHHHAGDDNKAKSMLINGKCRLVDSKLISGQCRLIKSVNQRSNSASCICVDPR